jgi:hypothetical protein
MTVTIQGDGDIIQVSEIGDSVTIQESPVSVTVAEIGIAGANGVGVPAGGTSGQVLAKIDGADYNTEWVDSSGGSGTENLFIQSTAPTVVAGIPYLWIDTTGGNLQFKIEDGA